MGATATPDEESSDENLPKQGRSIDSEQNVAYEYLTWDTQLPIPISPTPSPPSTTLPSQPDLAKYQNPLTWSRRRKDVLVWISCTGTLLTAYSAGCYAPGVDQMTAEWHISEVACLVGITVFTAGFAIAPMVLAPFSEINGRRPVFCVTGMLFTICVACCAATRIFPGMILARFFGGCMASVFSTMVGGVVADMFEAHERNTPMALFTGAALFGTGLGPLVSGFIAQNVSWRWIFGVHALVVAVLIAIVVTFFRETRGSVLLSRRARMLNQWYDECEKAGYGFLKFGEKESRRIRWKVKADEERASLVQMIRISLYRPFHLLITEPVVFFFSLWVSMSWSVLYMTFSAIPYVYSTTYAFTLQNSNAIFSILSIASILCTLLSIYQEKLASHYNLLKPNPESRLKFPCATSIFLPIGLFWFGWTASPSIPWIVPGIGLAFALLGIFSIYLATFNYLADCYGPYASSALAAQSFCRNMMGGAFPLFTRQMYERLGNGEASSLLGAIAVVLTGVPWVLAVNGKKIRARSKFASSDLVK